MSLVAVAGLCVFYSFSGGSLPCRQSSAVLYSAGPFLAPAVLHPADRDQLGNVPRAEHVGGAGTRPLQPGP